MDARRIPPTADTVKVTADQVRELVGRLGDTPVTPVFAFDAGYDPIALTHELADLAAVLVVRPGLLHRPRPRAGRRPRSTPQARPPDQADRPRQLADPDVHTIS